jgi:anti-sigma factor ChrR (cupin superfamily)
MQRTPHPSYDKLELFVLGRLGSSSVVQVEEHLLVCSACVEKARHASALAWMIKQALSGEKAATA